MMIDEDDDDDDDAFFTRCVHFSLGGAQKRTVVFVGVYKKIGSVCAQIFVSVISICLIVEDFSLIIISHPK